jgi:hypothetical protein
LAQSDPPTPNGVHYLQKTTDGGNTWNIQNTISTNGTCVLGTVVCIDNLFYAWAGYPPARIVLTSDGGTTWIQRNISNANYTSGVAFSSDKTTGIGESSGFLPNISRSTDGGNTWTQINTGLPNTSLEWGKVKWVYGTNTVFLTAETGASGCIGKSTNAGLNWSVMSTAGITNLYNIDLVYTGGMVYAYAISLSAQVIKLQEPVTGIGLHSREVPSEYRLEQNYPNPFNPTTNIKFEIINSKSETNPKTEIRIYDVLGKEVATLINENLKPGSYEVEWDASSFPSGVYFYRLTSGKFSETKKMILNK